MAGSAADCVSAYTQAKLEEMHRLLKLPKNKCPVIWIKIPRDRWPKWWFDKGFQNIREFARDKQRTRDQNKAILFVRNMFWRRNCGAAMTKWRQTEYEQTLEMISMTETQT